MIFYHENSICNLPSQYKIVATFNVFMKDETEEGLVESAISQLENGILILSAIKDGGSCSQKLACTLGNASKAMGSIVYIP